MKTKLASVTIAVLLLAGCGGVSQEDVNKAANEAAAKASSDMQRQHEQDTANQNAKAARKAETARAEESAKASASAEAAAKQQEEADRKAAEEAKALEENKKKEVEKAEKERQQAQAKADKDRVEASKAAETANSGSVKVTEVVDGDTIRVNLDGKSTSVRIIGIDTPETKDPSKPGVQCGGDEATQRAVQLLEGQEVTLVPDASQDQEDRYGRKLAYVTLPDGSDYGQTVLSEGFAQEYTYDKAYAKQAEYQAAEATAQANNAGIWSGSCAIGQNTQAPAAPAAPAEDGSVYFKNCDEAHAAGYHDIAEGSPGYRGALDRNKDGVACES